MYGLIFLALLNLLFSTIFYVSCEVFQEIKALMSICDKKGE
jgi:hypothetical protein